MRKITGTSKWREFKLPFDRTGASNAPVRLQFNLVLRGRGTVYLSPVKLVEYPGAKSAERAWWTDQAAGWWGGLGGGLIGCLGSLTAWLAWQGKARRFVVAVLTVLTSLGVLSGVAALAAFACRQPYAVWFPLSLGAALLLSICPYRLRQYQKKYEELELRRMASVDVSGAGGHEGHKGRDNFPADSETTADGGNRRVGRKRAQISQKREFLTG